MMSKINALINRLGNANGSGKKCELSTPSSHLRGHLGLDSKDDDSDDLGNRLSGDTQEDSDKEEKSPSGRGSSADDLSESDHSD